MRVAAVLLVRLLPSVLSHAQPGPMVNANNTFAFELYRRIAAPGENLFFSPKKMGMPLAFGDRADFSGIRKAPRLLISEVFHKSYVELNEEGTEAAAATGVLIEGLSVRPSPPAFKANRPFVYLIRHVKTNAILFLGRYAHP